MCGICGVVSSYLKPDMLIQISDRMTQALKHRGPDGKGIKFFAPPTVNRSIALGHNRLAIIDLSGAGHQPMSNEDETVWIAFNGEIYNFEELRKELESKGHSFRSHTDTEVIIHLYEELGPDCVQRLNGMFAFAILDLRQQQLLLARDPIGIKPLYYCDRPDLFLFGSEIKAILASGLYTAEVNWQAVYDYFTYLYVPCPQTVFQDICQLPPAHWLTLNLSDGSFKLERYWQVRRREEVEKASFKELKAMAHELLADSVRRQLISDVPLGVFLSGGVDSTIVSGLAKQVDASLRTFTVIFKGDDFRFYNEQETARAVSQHLKTDHHELLVPEANPLEILNLIEFFDQPFGNPTFYLMYLLSKQAREHLTVALCGAGGDELYAGYPRYRAVQLARRLGFLPRPLLKLGRKFLDLAHDSYRTMHLRRAKQFLEGVDSDFIRQFAKWSYHLDEVKKAKLLMGCRHFSCPNGLSSSERFLRTAMEESSLADADNRLLHMDVQTFLPDNLLEYSDKMSMAVGLEVRVPLLDHRFVEFSLNVPFAYKLKAGRSKILLRETFAEFFPAAVRKAPKRGFNVPLPQWMRQTFDEYFEASLQPKHPLKDYLGEDLGLTWWEGILDWSFIQQLREQHRQGRRDNSYELFAVIIFDFWWRKYIEKNL